MPQLPQNVPRIYIIQYRHDRVQAGMLELIGAFILQNDIEIFSAQAVPAFFKNIWGPDVEGTEFTYHIKYRGNRPSITGELLTNDIKIEFGTPFGFRVEFWNVETNQIEVDPATSIDVKRQVGDPLREAGQLFGGLSAIVIVILVLVAFIIFKFKE